MIPLLFFMEGSYGVEIHPDRRNIICFRFASHPELVPECPEVKRIYPAPLLIRRFRRTGGFAI